MILANTYEKVEKEHFAPEMSQCNPKDYNGYPKDTEAVNGAESAAAIPVASGDTTDSKGLAYPVSPKSASLDQNAIATYRQVKPSLQVYHHSDIVL